jgi:hypothetical protein
MNLETVTVSPTGLQMLRKFDKATVTARITVAANKEPTVPNGFGDKGGSNEQPLLKREKQRADALRKKPEEQKGKHKSTQGAASSAADTTGRGQTAGVK